MADKKITGLTELAEAPATGDLFEVVDVSDTTMAGTGTNKKITRSNLVPDVAPPNLLKNGNFINNSTNGYGGTPDDWTDDGNANPVQGGFPSMTKAQLISITGVADGDIEGLWNLDEASGNALDLSSNSYDLTDTNTVGASDDGLMASARDFELSNSEYFTLAHGSAPNLKITGSRTVFGWVKMESVISGTIFGAEDNTTAGYLLYMDSSGGVNWICRGLTTNTLIGSDVQWEAGKWYFVCGVYDSANTLLKIWVNGVKKEVTASGSTGSTSTSFNIGARNTTGATFDLLMDGLVQNVGVLSVALSDDQVKRLWATTTYKGQKIRRATTNGELGQALPQDLVERLRGKELTARAMMWQDTASTGQIEIDDGVTPAASSTTATTGSWVEVSATRTIDADATAITINLQHSTSDGNTWFKEVAVYEGSTLVYTWYPSYDDINRLSKILRQENGDYNKSYRVEGNLSYKLGALTTTELTKDGDVGYDETNNRMYLRQGGVVKYVAMA